ncbi:MAG: uracil-DNA glycosylase [Gemmatimonadetes bacterium]|nr:uracil-DNA glycosylase [Gemmatimonadota bacterium]
MTPSLFVKALQDLESDHAFNPYADRCPVYDLEAAPERRSNILLSVLEAALKSPVDSLWIGRDFGYRGGRRTGLAFTDDDHLPEHAGRWGLTLQCATREGMAGERSARAVWNVLSRVDAPVFLWNVFPLHPHDPGNPFSNRKHNARERASGEGILAQLVHMLEPSRIVAVGRDAAWTASRLFGRYETLAVRHPSHGGQKIFTNRMSEWYGLA